MIPQGHTTMAYAGTVIALASLLALLTVLSSALTSRLGIPVRSIYHGSACWPAKMAVRDPLR